MINAYQLTTLALMVALIAMLTFAVYSCVLLCIRWRTPQRRKFGKRLGVAILSAMCLIAVQQAILWWVVMPAMSRHQMAEFKVHRKRKIDESSFVRVGGDSPSFSITDVDGETYSVGGTSNDLIVINFFATWCGPCLKELPYIEQLWSQYQGRDKFRLLVIGREESLEVVREFREKHNFTFPIAPDSDRSIYSKFAKELIPRTIVVSSGGKVIYSTAGFDESEIFDLKSVITSELEIKPETLR